MQEKSSSAARSDIRINLRFGVASEKWLVEELARRGPYQRAKFLRELIRLGSQARRGKLPTLQAAWGAVGELIPKVAPNLPPAETALDQSVLDAFGKLIR